MVKTTLDIEGMGCSMCEAHINNVIRSNFKVKSVKSSHKKNTTEIISADPLDEELIKGKIGETGYEVKGVKVEEHSSSGGIFGLFSKK